MKETIGTRIKTIEQEIFDIEAAIELALNPSEYEVDTSRYPVLNQIRQQLAEAQSNGESLNCLQMFQDQIADRKTELTRLQLLQQTKEETIAHLKAEQEKVFAEYQALEVQATNTLKRMIAYGQKIAQEEEALVDRCRPGVVFNASATQVNRLLYVQLEDGRVVLGIQGSKVLEVVNDGLGGNASRIPNYTQLIEEKLLIAA